MIVFDNNTIKLLIVFTPY